MTNDTTTTTTDTATAVSRMISGATYHARMARRLRRADFEAAARDFAATPSATCYRAMEHAALALQDADAALGAARLAARREAIDALARILGGRFGAGAHVLDALDEALLDD